jgi:phosphoadenosine phosphosulfate reductase
MTRNTLDDRELSALNDSLRDANPREILSRVLPLLGKTALSFSGAEDVVNIAHCLKAVETRSALPAVFTLDTGRLHAATLRYLEQVRKHFDIRLDLIAPDPLALQNLVAEKGLFSFYVDGHEECCGIRKVAPLRRHLADFDAWISGQRRDQSPSRGDVPIIELDRNFSTPERRLIKVNPLANVSSAEVWNTIRLFDIPYNALHDQGFVSIGCEPCTKAIGPNQHEREGRWWWEESTIKECGLHRTQSS